MGIKEIIHEEVQKALKEDKVPLRDDIVEKLKKELK